MRKGKNWEKSKYYGMTDDEIKKLWDDNRIDASTKGTKMHLDIEGFYNNIDVQINALKASISSLIKNDLGVTDLMFKLKELEDLRMNSIT